MRKLIDDNILNLMNGLFTRLEDSLSVFTADAQALMAIFMILYFSNKIYGMMVGDQPLEIMPLLRPFGLALVVMFWGYFVDLINVPGQVITETARNMLDDEIEEVDAVQLYRLELINQVAQSLITMSAEVEQVKAGVEQEGEESVGWFGIDLSDMFSSIAGYYIIIMAKMRFYVVQLIESSVITLFQAMTYLVLFLQIVFASIMIILGPFSFAFSILDGFRDAYIQWIARYFSVSLYAGIAYIISSLSMVLVKYGMEREIEILEEVVKSEAALMAYVTASDGGGTSFFMVSLLVGALAMLSVPVISTWIVSTSGVGNAISSMTRGAGRIAGM